MAEVEEYLKSVLQYLLISFAHLSYHHELLKETSNSLQKIIDWMDKMGLDRCQRFHEKINQQQQSLRNDRLQRKANRALETKLKNALKQAREIRSNDDVNQSDDCSENSCSSGDEQQIIAQKNEHVCRWIMPTFPNHFSHYLNQLEKIQSRQTDRKLAPHILFWKTMNQSLRHRQGLADEPPSSFCSNRAIGSSNRKICGFQEQLQFQIAKCQKLSSIIKSNPPVSMEFLEKSDNYTEVYSLYYKMKKTKSMCMDLKEESGQMLEKLPEYPSLSKSASDYQKIFLQNLLKSKNESASAKESCNSFTVECGHQLLDNIGNESVGSDYLVDKRFLKKLKNISTSFHFSSCDISSDSDIDIFLGDYSDEVFFLMSSEMYLNLPLCQKNCDFSDLTHEEYLMLYRLLDSLILYKGSKLRSIVKVDSK